MDSYTSQTREWLNQRFRQTTPDGIFFAHQNIYGFRSPYCEPGALLRYAIFWNVVRALSQVQFDSLLDVGGAEGYMAAAIRQFFKVQVRSCDLSDEACARAREIFGIDADPVDGVSLPYPDGAFDVVLSSEAMEHIPDYDRVLKELLRVARKAVVITVPHDGPEAVAETIRQKVPHGHIHDFTLESFRSLVPSTYTIRAWGLWSEPLKVPFRLIEGRAFSLEYRSGFRRLLTQAINPVLPLAGRFLGSRAFKCLMRVDRVLANRLKLYRQLVFVIAKDPICLDERKAPVVDFDTVLDFRAPLYRMEPAEPAIHQSVTA